MAFGVMYRDLETEVILDQNELEKIARGVIIQGKIVNFPKKGYLYLSKGAKEGPETIFLDHEKDSLNYHFILKDTIFNFLRMNKNIEGVTYGNGVSKGKISIYSNPSTDIYDHVELNFLMQ